MYKFFYFKIEIKTKVDLYMPCEAMAHSTKWLHHPWNEVGFLCTQAIWYAKQEAKVYGTNNNASRLWFEDSSVQYRQFWWQNKYVIVQQFVW